MKIAHFSYSAYHQGGTSHYVLGLADLQTAAGNEVFQIETHPSQTAPPGRTPILVRDEGELFERCKALGIDVLHYHIGPRVKPPAGLPVVYTIHEHSPHCIAGGLFLKRQNKPCPRSYNFFGCAYGHLHDRCGSIRPGKFLDHFSRLKSQMDILPGRAVICVGSFLKNRMLASGYPDRNLFVVPNFVDMHFADPAMQSGDVPEFLYLGRLEKLKGVEWLVRSFAKVQAPSVLNICGLGDAEEELKALVSALGVAHRVRFWGWIENSTRAEFIKKARAVIVPSIWPEPFGLCAIEAGSAAKPVICSDAGELPYIIENGKNGIVVPVGENSALADAIEDLANDFSKAETLGLDNYRKYLALYNGKTHHRMVNEVYSTAMQQAEAALR